MSAPSPSSSASPADSSTPAERSTEFKAVENNEHFNGNTLVVEAYAFLWLVVMGWVLLMWRKSAALSERLDDLERVMDRAAAAVEAAQKNIKSG